MPSDGIMIVLIFAGILLVPLVVVLLVLWVNKTVRKKRLAAYTGRTTGQVERIVNKGMHYPSVIVARYTVDGAEYRVRETAKVKNTAIKLGGIPIGQRKTFVLGPLALGDSLTICYDPQNPQKALIFGNDGVQTD